jgi:hypothetical protein
VSVLLARTRCWRAALGKRRTSVLLAIDAAPEACAALEGFEVEVPLARWNLVVRNVESDRKLLGGVLQEGTKDKDRVVRVVGTDPVLRELQQLVRDATVALVEAGTMEIAPAREEES